MTVRPLSAALVELARSDLNEDPKRVRDDLQHIKDWLAKQQYLRARSGMKMCRLNIFFSVLKIPVLGQCFIKYLL